MKKILFLFIGFLLFYAPAFAANQTAVSCSVADVQTAVDAAGQDDTVFIPGDTCTWEASLDMRGKRRVLQGAGIDVTIITMSGGTAFSNVNAAGSKVSANNFTISGGYLATDGQDFLIHDMKFINYGIDVRGYDDVHPSGVIYKNQFSPGRVVIDATVDIPIGAWQNALWATEHTYGSYPYAIYVEDNIYYKDSDGVNNAMDENYGGRIAFRYNTVTTNTGRSNATYLEVHSSQTNNRGSKSWEIYGNSIVNNGTGYTPYSLRGGTGFVFFNSSVGGWTANKITLDNVRSFAGTEPYTYPTGTNDTLLGRCDGDNLADGNADATGWPCRDQIGRGYDLSACVGGTFTEGECPQASAPAYFFNNKKESNVDITVQVVNTPSENHIQADRDFYTYNASFDGTSGVGCGTLASRPATCTAGVGYWATAQSCSDLTGMVGASPATPISGALYKCTSTDTWTAYYTPYYYPHPLRDQVAPTITSLTVDPSGAFVTIHGSENLAVTTGAGYTLSSDGDAVTLTHSSISGTDIIQATSRTILSTETLTYSYTGTDTKDLSGNELAAITDEAVTNSSAQSGAVTGRTTHGVTGSTVFSGSGSTIYQ